MRQFLCAFALLVSVAVALKFELRPNEIQCFEEEMPDDVLVSGTFQSQKLFNQDLDLTVWTGVVTFLKHFYFKGFCSKWQDHFEAESNDFSSFCVHFSNPGRLPYLLY